MQNKARARHNSGWSGTRRNEKRRPVLLPPVVLFPTCLWTACEAHGCPTSARHETTFRLFFHFICGSDLAQLLTGTQKIPGKVLSLFFTGENYAFPLQEEDGEEQRLLVQASDEVEFSETEFGTPQSGLPLMRTGTVNGGAHDAFAPIAGGSHASQRQSSKTFPKMKQYRLFFGQAHANIS